MKKIKRNFLWLLVIVLSYGIFYQNINAQCVVCTPAPPGWICTNGQQGGEACSIDGITCTYISPCVGCQGNDCPETLSKSEPCKLTKGNKTSIYISNDIIKEIGTINPHAAIALISIRNLPPLSYNEGKINVAKIDLTIEDVENHLVSPLESYDYLNGLKVKVSESFTRNVSPVVYDFYLEDLPVENKYILRLNQYDASAKDVSLFSLEIDLITEEATNVTKADETKKLTSALWRIK